jgi:D-3-phosphoglycerate dehydrogenase
MVLVYDPITVVRWSYAVERDELARHGVELVVPSGRDEAVALLESADVLLTSSHLPVDHLRRLRRSSGVLCYQVGTELVDPSVAADRGLHVMDVPDWCTEDVSDLALALLLALNRLLLPFGVAAAEGNWNVRGWPEFMTNQRRLSGQTLGIVGFGRIGRRVAEKAQAFGMTILACRRSRNSEVPPYVSVCSLAELLRSSDAVVLCASLNSSTEGLLDRASLALMRRDAVLINVGRGHLIDEDALAEALKESRLRGAALDVRQEEPPAESDVLRALPNVILTQHIGASTREAFHDLHSLTAGRVLELLRRANRLE